MAQIKVVQWAVYKLGEIHYYIRVPTQEKKSRERKRKNWPHSFKTKLCLVVYWFSDNAAQSLAAKGSMQTSFYRNTNLLH